MRKPQTHPQPPASTASDQMLFQVQRIRVALEADVRRLRDALAQKEQECAAVRAENRRIKDLLHELCHRQALPKQSIPDILYCLEFYIGGVVESRYDRLLRSENMAQTSVLLRELIGLVLGNEAFPEV
jgi:hypothetical protein